MTGAILVNSILKLTVLHNTIYQNLFSFFPFLHLIASTAIEHAVFVSAVILGTLEVLPTTLIIISHGCFIWMLCIDHYDLEFSTNVLFRIMVSSKFKKFDERSNKVQKKSLCRPRFS
jgi:hypothetical protein